MASPARQERDSQVGFWVKGVYLQVLSFLSSLCSPLFFYLIKVFFVFLTILQIKVPPNRILASSTRRA